ncbi:MAG: ATP-dependent ligase [Alphaproteobacteria bacterium]|nr:ATP-dependent ligase [Alphaproteobacteria bacterium]
MSGFEQLSVKPGLAPMEAKLVDVLPREPGWQYEPKWDGFRCLIFRAGGEVELQSKSGKPLARYFPEIVAAVLALDADKVVLDGELIISIGDHLSFDALQMRLHPADSRIRRLSRETPARVMLFDCLTEDGDTLLDRPLWERRAALERLYARNDAPAFRLSPYTNDADLAQQWLDQAGGALDGVVAKRRDAPYEPGERAMLKIKQMRTADCVVGGFRYGANSREVGSLLLGMYNREGKLDHVGFTSSIPPDTRAALTKRLEALSEPPGFTGNAPGGPSRWSTDRSGDWQPLRPELVAEVRYDHVTGHRFRHGTKFLRWRPDKAPEQCRMDQLEHEARPAQLIATLEGAQ